MGEVLEQSSFEELRELFNTMKYLCDEWGLVVSLAEGHTDDISIRSARYRNNWELSTSRVVSVLQYLIDVYGYPSHRLSVAGYGSTHPIN